MPVTTPVLEELDVAAATDADVLALHALETAIEQEAHPGDPVKPDAQALLDLRVWPSYRHERRWVVRDAGRIVASGSVVIEDVLDNQHLAEIDLRVHPGARRRGLATALLPKLVETARAWGRTSLYAEIRVGRAGEACACDLVEPVGRTQPTVSHHLSVLVDAGLLTREKRGKWAWFRPVPERLAVLRDALRVP